MLIAFRLDILDEGTEGRVRHWISSHNDDIIRCVIVKEISSISQKPHYQGILDIPSITTNQGKEMKRFRKEMIELVGINYKSRSQQYTFVEVKKQEEYMTYILKGDRGSVSYFLVKGYDSEFLKKYEGKWTAFEPSNKKENLASILREYVRSKEHYFLYDSTGDVSSKYYRVGTDKMLNRKKLLEVIIDFFGGKDHSNFVMKPFSSKLVQDYFNALEYQYCPEMCKKRVINELMEKLSLDISYVFEDV